MAIWHLRTKVISRAKGQSVVASAAYRSGEKLRDERYEMTHDYSRKAHVVHKEIMAPDDAPARFQDRQTLWNEVEATERRINSQLAREVEVAIPRELSPEDRIAVVRQFVREQFVSRGMIADVAIHAPEASDGEEAPHAHILLTMREVGPEGFGGKKQRLWNDRSVHEHWRAGWERTANDMLRSRGFEARIDRRSNKDRRRVFEPCLHEGASWQERRRKQKAKIEIVGSQAHRVEENEARRARNQARIEADPALVLAELTHHHSTFTERDVARFLNRYVDDERDFLNLKARVLGHDEAVRLGVDEEGRDRYSTRSQVAVERDILEIGDRLNGRLDKRRINREKVADYLSERGLSQEQKRAVLHLVGDEGLLLASGIAGAGKTTMLRGAADVWRARGYQPRGVALAATAATVLEAETGIKSQTVARFLMRLDHGEERLSPKDVVVLDEAGMLHSHHMRRLMVHVEKTGAKLVMVGDSEQIQAVEAGAPFRALEARLGTARMVETRRQRDQGDREATVAFSTGRTASGLAHYEREGAIHRSDTREEMLREVVRRYLDDRTELGADKALLLAHLRRDVSVLNRMIRDDLVERGLVEEGRSYALSRGERHLGRGDSIVFLKNDYEQGLRNGMTGTVIAAGAQLKVQEGKREILIDPSKYPHLDHAYARTLHKGQGATAERAHVVLTGSMDRNLTYVGMTRHRGSVQAYWARDEEGSYEELVARLSRSGLKDMTTDYAVARVMQLSEERRIMSFIGKLMVATEERREAREKAALRQKQEAEQAEDERRRQDERMEQERIRREEDSRTARERIEREEREAKSLSPQAEVANIGASVRNQYAEWSGGQAARSRSGFMEERVRKVRDASHTVDQDIVAIRAVGREFFVAFDKAVENEEARGGARTVIAGMTETGAYRGLRTQLDASLRRTPAFATAWDRLRQSAATLGVEAQNLMTSAVQRGAVGEPNVKLAEEYAARAGYRLENLPGRGQGQNLLEETNVAMEKVVDRHRAGFVREDRRMRSYSQDNGPSPGM